ncbi:nucleoside/nucleotide kinase family protein [Acuticoccus sp. MNP-M23]|uniref:nucleoside/nucleotide kinase family protein n=1 Tax=Acuticoccus sp. MNP-M23 TaxID=3072793 RepID=UPI0028162FD0|nr:nucleoside/nucleotide kinase family protein [Acuticoccus sp. MNP-M23]WMS42391.1 nucleoside/nucleotide kinase family protein [Acuticoccus sp. MNP-M23]
MRTLGADAFTAELVTLAGQLTGGERRIIAIAGPPASGKSTLAEAVVDAANEAHPGRAALLPQDGFHYDDELLRQRGHLARKGAPHTFDVGGLASALHRLRAGEDTVVVPRFDRSIEIARAGAILIGRDARLIVCEGNYLLLDEAPWRTLARAFDMTATLDVDEAELERRLTARWEGHGLAPADIAAKVDENDLPNARLVTARSRKPDIRII